jgi:hypothetical protein
MGYTHYMRQESEVPTVQWKILTEAVNKVLSNLPKYSTSAGAFHSDEPIIVQFECVDNSLPEVGDQIIRFNGADEMGHETFMIGQDFDPNGETFHFCKTARKPYDYVVCAVLILLNHYSPGSYKISSDGEPDDWIPVLTDLRSLFEDDTIMLPGEVQEEWEQQGLQVPDAIEPEGEKPLFHTNNPWF